MPLPSVKKRSNLPVISVSISSGAMPLYEVATTTSGRLMDGNRSTGILTTQVAPMIDDHQRGDDDQVRVADGESGHYGRPSPVASASLTVTVAPGFS